MQINGAQLANLYISRPSTLDDKVRAPVVIDGKSFKVDDTPQQVSPSLTQQRIELNDTQQSRFIREFSINDEPSSSSQLQVIKPSNLPEGVQQYLAIARIDDNDGIQLLDETV
jgi:hypothetical protein